MPRQDSNSESFLRLGLPNSMEEGGSCRGVDGGGCGGGVPQQYGLPNSMEDGERWLLPGSSWL